MNPEPEIKELTAKAVEHEEALTIIVRSMAAMALSFNQRLDALEAKVREAR